MTRTPPLLPLPSRAHHSFAHAARAFDQIAGRRMRRQVVNDGASVGVRQQLAGLAQVLGQFSNGQQHRGGM
jgi:hypothetical protein